MHRNAGFTLMETLVALAIAGVLATVSARLMQDAALAGHAAVERTALAETLLASLNRSTITGRKVVVCASADGKTCGGVDWSGGWMAFVDDSDDREHDEGEAMVRVHPRLMPGIRLRTSVGRTRIVFQPFGGLNAGTNVTFTFCDGRGAGKASTIILANSGNMRTAPATPEQAEACLGAG